jgi:hypothetical protein
LVTSASPTVSQAQTQNQIVAQGVPQTPGVPKPQGVNNGPGSAGGSLTVKPQVHNEQKQMFARADMAVNNTRASFKLPPLPPPRDHFQRVSNVVDTYNRLVAADKANPGGGNAASQFLFGMERIGAPFGMNFGLSGSRPLHPEGGVLNAGRFNGVSANDDHLRANQQSQRDFAAGGKTDAQAKALLGKVNTDPDTANISKDELKAAAENNQLSPQERAAARTALDKWQQDASVNRVNSAPPSMVMRDLSEALTAQQPRANEVTSGVNKLLTSWAASDGNPNDMSVADLNAAQTANNQLEATAAQKGVPQEQVGKRLELIRAAREAVDKSGGSPIALPELQTSVFGAVYPTDPKGVPDVQSEPLLKNLDQQGPNGVPMDNMISKQELVDHLTYGTLSSAERFVLNRVLQESYASPDAKPISLKDFQTMVENVKANMKPSESPALPTGANA